MARWFPFPGPHLAEQPRATPTAASHRCRLRHRMGPPAAGPHGAGPHRGPRAPAPRVPARRATAPRVGRPRKPRGPGHLRRQPPQPPRHTAPAERVARPVPSPHGGRRGGGLLLHHPSAQRHLGPGDRDGPDRTHAGEPALGRRGGCLDRRRVEPGDLPRRGPQSRRMGSPLPGRSRVPGPAVWPAGRAGAPRRNRAGAAARRTGTLPLDRPRQLRPAAVAGRGRGQQAVLGPHRRGRGGIGRRACHRLVGGTPTSRRRHHAVVERSGDRHWELAASLGPWAASRS